MTAITFSDFTNTYDPILRVKVDEGFGRVPSAISALYNIQQSTATSEKLVDILGPDLFSEFTGSHNAGALDEGFPVTFTHKEYEKELAIRKAMFDDGNPVAAYIQASRFGVAAAKTRETHAASVFNNAFATQLSADGNALCSADHPAAPGDATNDQSNVVTTALSEAAVAAGIEAMLSFTDKHGNPAPSVADTLVVPVGLRKEALTIAESAQLPGSANNDINTVRGLRVIVWPYLTDQNNWFLVDSVEASNQLFWFERHPFDVALDPKSEYDRIMRYSGYMRYSFGPVGWRWVYGANVA